MRSSGVIIFLPLHKEASVLRKPESSHLSPASTLTQHLVVGGCACCCYFLCCWDHTPGRSSWRNKGCVPAPSSRSQPVLVGKWWKKELKAGSHVLLREPRVLTCRSLTWRPRTPAHGVCCPQLRGASTFHASLT